MIEFDSGCSCSALLGLLRDHDQGKGSQVKLDIYLESAAGIRDNSTKQVKRDLQSLAELVAREIAKSSRVLDSVQIDCFRELLEYIGKRIERKNISQDSHHRRRPGSKGLHGVVVERSERMIEALKEYLLEPLVRHSGEAIGQLSNVYETNLPLILDKVQLDLKESVRTQMNRLARRCGLITTQEVEQDAPAPERRTKDTPRFRSKTAQVS